MKEAATTPRRFGKGDPRFGMSPMRMFLTVLAIIFLVEASVMVILLGLLPKDFDDRLETLLDATLMTALIGFDQ